MAGTLAGKTLFITGASRGIGLAIALRAARDGANIAVAAKTAEPHPKLAGTIHEAAAAIEAAGGHALPLLVDVRDEASVEAGVAATVERFGGIDICVANASAIRLTGTFDTPVKAFDLMHGVNGRGTWLVARTCLPHLLKAANPHILAMAPPLPIEPGWIGPYLAYAMAKFGMSMVVKGLAEEFAEAGIAVNGLWPRTVIATAAVEFAIDAGMMKHARTPEIMADAAHAIVSAPSRARTGRFLIDDVVLSEAGVTDFSVYQDDPEAALQVDFFVPSDTPPPPPGTTLIDFTGG